MRSLALAVIAASVAFCAAAPANESGIKIPLSPRKRFTNKDGTANIPLLQNHLARSLDKVSRGVDAFERNTGAKHPLDTGNLNRLTKRATGADPLTDDDEELWQGAISVGAPAKGFTGKRGQSQVTLLVIEAQYSGFRHRIVGPLPSVCARIFFSVTTIVTGIDRGSACGTTCRGHTLYNPAASSASANTRQRFSLAFGDGSTVQGTLFTDTVTVAGITVSTSTRIWP